MTTKSFPGLATLLWLALSALAVAPAGATEPKALARGTPATLPTVAPAVCDERFAAFDTNRDGKLSFQEFADGRFGMIRFASAPSAAEVRSFKSRYLHLARAADANRDGWLTVLEHRAQCQHNDGP